MFASDRDNNGLIEYPTSGNYGDRPTDKRRPANWWDTINFGHEDAFANALACRGATMFAITRDDLDSIVRNFRARQNGEINVDYDHASEMPEVAAGGPVVETETIKPEILRVGR